MSVVLEVGGITYTVRALQDDFGYQTGKPAVYMVAGMPHYLGTGNGNHTEHYIPVVQAAFENTQNDYLEAPKSFSWKAALTLVGSALMVALSVGLIVISIIFPSPATPEAIVGGVLGLVFFIPMATAAATNIYS